jgi:hypothetical protein
VHFGGRIGLPEYVAGHFAERVRLLFDATQFRDLEVFFRQKEKRVVEKPWKGEQQPLSIV